MGSFYTNYTVRGPGQPAVAAALAGRAAAVTPQQGGSVVVFDEDSEDQDQALIARVATDLSRDLRCAVLAVMNHDDDVLWYAAFNAGSLVDEYDSSPGYFDPEAEASEPAGGNAERLCAAFGSTAVDAVEGVLRRSSFTDDGYDSATSRHGDLVAALGLPDFGVGLGYRYISDGELPAGLSEDDLLRSSRGVA